MRKQTLIRIDNRDKVLLDNMKDETGLSIPTLLSAMIPKFQKSKEYKDLKAIINSKKE